MRHILGAGPPPALRLLGNPTSGPDPRQDLLSSCPWGLPGHALGPAPRPHCSPAAPWSSLRSHPAPGAEPSGAPATDERDPLGTPWPLRERRVGAPQARGGRGRGRQWGRTGPGFLAPSPLWDVGLCRAARPLSGGREAGGSVRFRWPPVCLVGQGVPAFPGSGSRTRRGCGAGSPFGVRLPRPPSRSPRHPDLEPACRAASGERRRGSGRRGRPGHHLPALERSDPRLLAVVFAFGAWGRQLLQHVSSSPVPVSPESGPPLHWGTTPTLSSPVPGPGLARPHWAPHPCWSVTSRTWFWVTGVVAKPS